MRTYAQFRPTGFDASGLALPDRQDWLVAPVSQTRDSEALDQSNFATALSRLGGESETIEVHRFGHWGPGWFEIILIDPSDTARVEVAESIESSLEDYPVLDEMDLSNREYAAYLNDWEHWAPSDFARLLQKKFDLSDTLTDRLWDSDVPLREFYQDELDGEIWSENHTRGPMESAVRKCTREQLARFAWTNRHAKKEVTQ